MTYLVTFMSSGGLTVEANSPEEAKLFFEALHRNDAMRELMCNGIDVTDVTEVTE